jgi:hypothetical protein
MSAASKSTNTTSTVNSLDQVSQMSAASKSTNTTSTVNSLDQVSQMSAASKSTNTTSTVNSFDQVSQTNESIEELRRINKNLNVIGWLIIALPINIWAVVLLSK